MKPQFESYKPLAFIRWLLIRWALFHVLNRTIASHFCLSGERLQFI